MKLNINTAPRGKSTSGCATRLSAASSAALVPRLAIRARIVAVSSNDSPTLFIENFAALSGGQASTAYAGRQPI
jgi:hypothetical protein